MVFLNVFTENGCNCVRRWKIKFDFQFSDSTCFIQQTHASIQSFSALYTNITATLLFNLLCYILVVMLGTRGTN